jgi:hypothetical protein
MTNTTDNSANGKYEFTINYSERELTCHVEREGNTLHLHIDNNMNADLEIQPDGSLQQTSGQTLPPSTLEFVKKEVLGH